MMPRLTDVVKHLLIINVVMYFGTMFIMGENGRLVLAMYFPTSEYFQPFQIVSHMFMHGNLTHLLFNMYALFLFGPPLEQHFGSQRFLFYYFFCGFGALGLYLFVRYLEMQYLDGSPRMIEAMTLQMLNTPMLGASGAIFGLLAGFGTIYPNQVLQLIFPPIALKAKYFVLIYAGLELFLGLGSFNTGVAHFAHLGGALFGFLLIMYWRYQSQGRT